MRPHRMFQFVPKLRRDVRLLVIVRWSRIVGPGVRRTHWELPRATGGLFFLGGRAVILRGARPNFSPATLVVVRERAVFLSARRALVVDNVSADVRAT